LYQAVYRLPSSQRKQAAGERVAVVDDVISAGSSARATVAELEAAGARVQVVGALLLLGNKAVEHFSQRQIPVVAPARRAFEMWEPDQCPHCKAGKPLQIP
jgi:orotate phosphoribosyltransferase